MEASLRQPWVEPCLYRQPSGKALALKGGRIFNLGQTSMVLPCYFQPVYAGVKAQCAAYFPGCLSRFMPTTLKIRFWISDRGLICWSTKVLECQNILLDQTINYINQYLFIHSSWFHMNTSTQYLLIAVLSVDFVVHFIQYHKRQHRKTLGFNTICDENSHCFSLETVMATMARHSYWFERFFVEFKLKRKKKHTKLFIYLFIGKAQRDSKLFISL